MNLIRFFSLFLIFSLSSAALSEPISSKEPRWKQLSQAYGFILGQQASLELIEKKYPDLAVGVKNAWFSFNSTALGESVRGVEEELSKLLGERWPEYKKLMTAQISSQTNEQNVSLQHATAFLQEIHERAKGIMPDSILITLLSAHPRFSKNSGLELSSGWKQIFRTKGHLKAKGIDFSLSLPISWSKREGNRPNIIQVFRSGAGHGPIMCNLMVKNIPLPAGYVLSKNELKEFFQPNELKDMVPDGGAYIDAKSIVLEGNAAGILISDQTMQRLDMTLTMRMTQFITIHDNSMIFIQFILSEMPDSNESLEELQKKYFPTFNAIANTFVLNDLYK